MPDPDTVDYRFEPNRDLWDSWKRTVPRDVALYRRIETLLRADRDNDPSVITSDADPDADPEPDDGDRVALIRARRHVMRGSQALTESDGGVDREAAQEAFRELNQLLESRL